MAFRASNVVPQDAYLTLKRAAVQLKINLVGQKAKLAASGASYDFLQDIYLTMTRANGQFDALKVTPGLSAYAQAQESDNTYDVAAEFTSMQAAIIAAAGWMDANVPTSVTVKPPSAWSGGEIISNVFTAGQTTGLQAALQGVIDEII